MKVSRLRLPLLVILTSLSAAVGRSSLAQTAEQEREGIDPPSDQRLQPPPAPRAANSPANEILLIPESTHDRVMAFDAITGDLLDVSFIPPDSANLSTPIHAILSASGDSILVSDQTDDVVQEYDLFGNYLGIFAPAGGVDTSILENIRGMSLRSNGNLLVSVADGGNADAIAEFDTAGNYLGNFVAKGADGLESPFDIFFRANDALVTAIVSDAIHSFDLSGGVNPKFSLIEDFPEQVVEISNGQVLVGNFQGAQEGVVRYDSAGNPIGNYNPAAIGGGNRGVYELPSGNILTTNSSGVHEMDGAGNYVRTIIANVSARFIEYVDLDFGNEYGQGCPGSGGHVPTLSMRGCPRIGNTIAIDIGNGLGGAPATYFVGLAPASQPAFGCTLLVEPPFFFTLSVPLGGTPGNPGEGQFSLPVPIPSNPNLIGRIPYFQAAVVDPGATRGLAFSNGLSFTIQ